MKKLYLYPIPMLFSYLLFDGMNMVSIWTFILPIVITQLVSKLKEIA